LPLVTSQFVRQFTCHDVINSGARILQYGDVPMEVPNLIPVLATENNESAEYPARILWTISARLTPVSLVRPRRYDSEQGECRVFLTTVANQLFEKTFSGQVLGVIGKLRLTGSKQRADRGQMRLCVQLSAGSHEPTSTPGSCRAGSQAPAFKATTTGIKYSVSKKPSLKPKH